MAYLGSWKMDDYLVITANTSRASSGAAYAATAITYRIYADDTSEEIVSDTDMTPFDSETGFYLNRVQLAATAGFVRGHCYTVLIKATVDGVAGVATHTFQIEAEVTANTVTPEVGITQNGADKVWGSAAATLKKILAYAAGNVVRTNDNVYAFKDLDASTTVMTHVYDDTNRTVS